MCLRYKTLLFFFLLFVSSSLFARDSLNVTLMNKLDFHWGEIQKTIIDGDYLYVACAETGLHIVDISDGDNPEIVGNYYNVEWVSDLDVQGDYAYLVDFEIGILSLDISDPANPNLDDTYSSGNKYTSIEIVDTIAYVGELELDVVSKLVILNISSPGNPEYDSEITMDETEGWGWAYVENIRAYGSNLFVYTEGSSMGTMFSHMDIFNRSNPVDLVQYEYWQYSGLDLLPQSF